MSDDGLICGHVSLFWCGINSLLVDVYVRGETELTEIALLSVMPASY
jgi:hypothetical protein